LEREGFERVWPESFSDDEIQTTPVLTVAIALVESIGRIADNTERATTAIEAVAKHATPLTASPPKGISAVIPDAIYTVEEVTELIRISLSEVHALTQVGGPIPCMRIGRAGKIKRVLGRDILAYLESSKGPKPETKYELKHLG